ncbi:MAG: rod shape-determining protein, partial [Actinomycetota bacterium]
MGRDLAIDLGTANTLVYRQGEGIIFDEPAVVAMHGGTGEVLAMGEEAWQMIGGDSGSVVAVRPLRAGTMTEFDITQRMLEVVLRRVGVSRLMRPRVLACVPSLSSEVEKRAIEEAIRFAGGRQVTLVEEPLAAAIGAGLPVHEPIGNLVVDIGGGRSEMAVVSMGGVVSGRSASIGGFDLDAAVQQHIRDEYGVAIGEKAAEEIKVAIESAFPTPGGKAAVVIGRQLSSGNTVEVTVTEDEIRKAIGEPVRGIVEAARL